MFKRISYDEWQAMAPIIAFALTFAVFVFQVIRALVIKPEHSRYLASLPLESEEQTSDHTKPKT